MRIETPHNGLGFADGLPNISGGFDANHRNAALWQHRATRVGIHDFARSTKASRGWPAFAGHDGRGGP